MVSLKHGERLRKLTRCVKKRADKRIIRSPDGPSVSSYLDGTISPVILTAVGTVERRRDPGESQYASKHIS